MKVIQKGDKELVRGTLTDVNGTGIAFASLVAMTCKTELADGTDYETYSKGGVSPNDIVVNADDANGYEFEVTVAHSNAFAVGIIYGVFTITITNTTFSSNQQVVVKRFPLFEVTSGG